MIPAHLAKYKQQFNTVSIMARVIYYSEDVTVYESDRADSNGNARHIVHFLHFITPEEENRLNNDILKMYDLAVLKAKGYFRRYTAREFGGGLIRQTDFQNGRETAETVRRIRDGKK